MEIAFIGLGNMGGPMAANLLKAGHALTVFDLDANAVGAAVRAGATAAASPRDAAARGALIITMLPAAQHVRAVYLGDDGVLAGARAGATLVDCSTIDPGTVRAVADAAARRDLPLADAPVSGGTGGAQAGTLTFMVGADGPLFERIRPVLLDMGRNVVHCGGTGTGQIAKICNNLLLGISMMGVAEAMALGAALGIDPAVLAGIINTSTGRCWSSDTYNPYPGVSDAAPAARGYAGGFAANLMLKDLGLATEAARGAHQPVWMGALAQQLYQSMSQQGLGTLDFSACVKLYEAQPA
ncbi:MULTISPECIES: 3-hydroxyisobutyrate dehydrogenase [Burkholderia]|uniref:3-hydroxyisobutyrate dehydrogenase n=1 Tax=Burkholderia anthinoferrum TaxID=3090833 RepID=A0ABU5WN11_9BURK|nr:MULTISPECIES: 3-hydroxyisobutyrate dehydrogenase [Burkholderia]MEB2504199.1 3-hydroxyisobutyrate dehydrogenase [Burkholderia anthinoferrum]MEB2530412.1 3-hydroxyisobutyrate dehydrogenase [Burkholderia anthinoferrum]MEB2565338.1 3-hydroxyisobutyrate dehydrogenase [Burkholderia anthinoferrum]MEB2580357.1 3-hydroxyisobutyrate dehydrogenase [Burkholderia anthinoferrum]MCA8106548.1 3-hydroxyisobutyrate dehydrogenase [Burkholderia sp. AU36459]